MTLVPIFYLTICNYLSFLVLRLHLKKLVFTKQPFCRWVDTSKVGLRGRDFYDEGTLFNDCRWRGDWSHCHHPDDPPRGRLFGAATTRDLPDWEYAFCLDLSLATFDPRRERLT